MINEFAQHQIECIKEKCKMIRPLVAIHCFTYNQEEYLRKALNSFLAQKVNFSFVIIVHDDASIDNTAKILKEYAEIYPNLIFPIYEEENQFSRGNLILSKIMDEACLATGAKYIAWCEGDDYWIDPLKLQKQVDLLEKNSQATACYGAFKTVDNNDKEISIPFYEECMNQGKSGDQFEELVKTNYILTCTFMAKKEIIDSKIYQQRPNLIDYGLFLAAAYQGPLIYINEPLSAYRINPAGMMHTQQRKVSKLGCESQLYFWEIAIEDNHKITKNINNLTSLWRLEHRERAHNKYNTIKKLQKKSFLPYYFSMMLWFSNMVLKKLKIKK